MCTILKETVNGKTLVGENEDWSDLETKVWFPKS
jgi:hypothetical protein